jgi:hypothetical protein
VSSKPNYWTTLPGVLTAVAATLSATAAIVGLAVRNRGDTTPVTTQTVVTAAPPVTATAESRAPGATQPSGGRTGTAPGGASTAPPAGRTVAAWAQDADAVCARQRDAAASLAGIDAGQEPRSVAEAAARFTGDWATALARVPEPDERRAEVRAATGALADSSVAYTRAAEAYALGDAAEGSEQIAATAPLLSRARLTFAALGARTCAAATAF